MSDASKIVKLILLGDPECGKTSLLLRYCKDIFSAESEVTIDESFERKLATTNDGEREVQVWDTAGEERFRNLTSSTYRGAHGILLVYDVSNKESFDNLVNWIGDIKLQRGTVGDEVPTVIVANKIDKADGRKISLADGEAFAASHKLPHIQTSALTGENVGDAFKTLIDIIIPPVVVATAAVTTTTTTTTSTPTRAPTESKGCCRIV